LMVHSVLALATEGVPLGLLHQEVWVRDPKTRGKAAQREKRKLEEKESQRWVAGLNQAQALISSETQVIVIGDCESDLFEFFAAERQAHAQLLVRARHRRRKIEGLEQPLESHLLAQPPASIVEIKIPTKTGSRSRTAKLELRWARLTIRPPDRVRSHAVELNFVSLREITPPPNGEEPIDWLLATSVEINSLDGALQVVQWYTRRWRIEEFHRTLKTGCRFEQRQLEQADALRRLLVCYGIVSWRLMWLTYEARTEPEQSCEKVLNRAEWQVLCVQADSRHRLPASPPTLSQAVHMIGRLGGHLGRKSDGSPGTQCLWRGLTRLQDLALGWQAFQELQHDATFTLDSFG
jgi:hypothetical protein